MKKIIGYFIAITAFVLPAVSFAATFNSDPQDFATLRVTNYTVNVGNTSCLTCWAGSATANMGDIVSFAIYYHNVGPDTATNVRVKLSPQVTTVGNTHTFSATVSADNAPAVSGTAVVTTTSSQSISFLQNGVIWRPNQTSYGSVALPSGQLATDLFNGVGVNLGNIAPGWTTQGSVVVRFQVSTNGGSGLSLPSVTTNSASSVTNNSVVFNGYVAPNGAATSAWFEWGTTPSFGSVTPSVNYGTNAVNFTNSLTNINSNTTYYYRAVAQNSQGLVQGSTMSFTTSAPAVSLPIVTTNTPNVFSQTSATLNGYVTSNSTSVNTWFEWGTTSSFGSMTPSVSYGTSATSFSNTLFNLNANTTYYYRAVAQNSQGTIYGGTINFMTSGSGLSLPSVTTNSASSVTNNSVVFNGYVAPNGAATSAWFEWGTTPSFGSVTPSVNYGTNAVNFTNSLTNINSNTTYYYRAVAQNSQGTTYGNTLSFVTGSQAPGTTVVGSTPSVTTLIATELTGSTAKLNGLVFSSENQSSSAWFEWGTSSTLGNKTQTTSVGNLPTVKHSDFITGLTQGQKYYYRVVAENTAGRVYGTIDSFVSGVTSVVSNPPVTTTPTPTTVVVKPSTTATTTVVVSGVTSQAPVSLSIDGGSESINGGEKRAYRVSWKNESTQSFKNVVLRITFPNTVTVNSATKGSFSSADNTVIVDMKTFAPGENGDTLILATTDRNLKKGEMLVVTANIVYTGETGVQGDAIAYVTHIAEVAPSALTASVLGAGEFIPTTLLGWVLLVTMSLVLVFLGNHLYGRFVAMK